MRWLRAVGRASIWHPQAVRADDETRNFKRVWLPIWLGLAMWSGANAIIYGSRIIDRLYGHWTDLAGSAYILVAALAFVAAAFPRLWALAIAAAILLIGMNAVYISGVAFAPTPEQLAAKEAPNWFIVTQLAGLVVMLPAWIEILLTEWVARRAAERFRARASRD